MKRLMQLFAPRDMTKGAPWQSIVFFAAPMLIGNFIQQLYNTVDTAVVGQYVGDNAVAAVSASFPVLHLLIALFVGVATGAGIRVSQYYGARDHKNLSLVIGNAITLSTLTSVLVMAVAIPLVDPLLRLLNTPQETFQWTRDYLVIILWGVAGMLFYNMLSGILRGLGDSLSSLLFLLICSILNIVLDLWFVISFRMGVTGVALATVIAQGVSGVLCYLRLLKLKHLFSISKDTLKLDRSTSLDIIRLGLPSGVTQASFSLAMMMVLRLENSFGPMFIATTGILRRVDGFAMLPNFSFGQAMTTYVGQNVGAKEFNRVKQGSRQGTLIAVATSVFLTLMILFFGRSIMHIFTNTQAIIDRGMTLVKVLSLGYIAMSVTQCMSGIMRGAGDTITPMRISIFTAVFLRTALAYLLVHLSKTPENPLGNPILIYVSVVVTWTVGAVINYYFYRHGSWRRNMPDNKV